MFRAKIQVNQNDKTKWEYLFSDTTKEALFATVIKLPDGIKPRKDLEGYLDKYNRPMLEKAWGRMWKGWYFVNIELHGQGNRRTAMAEAAAKSLKASGLQAGVYYQMD